jgi:hypothetical protein
MRAFTAKPQPRAGMAENTASAEIARTKDARFRLKAILHDALEDRGEMNFSKERSVK